MTILSKWVATLAPLGVTAADISVVYVGAGESPWPNTRSWK